MNNSSTNAIRETNFDFAAHQTIYHGKVRDVYDIGSLLIMVVSDRISAFDHILPRAIPYKGQVLNQVAAHFMRATEDIVPNWMLAVPDPNVTIGRKCEPFRIEMVIRGYLAGHAWREYKSGKRQICGEPMPEGMRQNEKFPRPLITPATKAESGHDEDISRDDILEKGIVSEEDYSILEKYTRALFARGSLMARERGLILVDTKYEFGKADGQIYLIDEIHTPDSSRYFYQDGYDELLEQDKPQRQLSKEFVREWLMENGFQGLEGQQMPEMPDDFVEKISSRYIELYEQLTGEDFEKPVGSDPLERIEQAVKGYLSL